MLYKTLSRIDTPQQNFRAWKGLILICIFFTLSLTKARAQDVPALLPLPQKISWGQHYFPLSSCKSIIIDQDSLKRVALYLKDIMAVDGFKTIIKKSKVDKFSIHLKIGRVVASRLTAEAYQLSVDQNHVVLTANTLHGIFNGIQTLRQLMKNAIAMRSCSILDYPAFAWRGYMVDVGRNYQSIPLLKQQIDVLAAMKMNIFHFHLTEDIAWRLQVKGFPQLTEAKNMIRNPGLFYTENELKELIAYCNVRYIQLVPEIDMPGHSAAFKRAMGFDMQSDSGTIVMKRILTEICQAYNIPYIHIGADEVRIANKNFLPQMISLIESKEKKVIGWQPGGDFTLSVIRQLWGDDNGTMGDGNVLWQIDSRNLYINHMDAEESVVSIFNHQLCDVPTGNNYKLGGILCLWNDRRLNNGADNLTNNPVYPAILAFAEKAWRGGGTKGNQVYLSDTNTQEYQNFSAFEDRLIKIKKTFFARLPFPYVKQANIHWQLIGPYNNNGDLSASFAPEKAGFDFAGAHNKTEANGATVILRHFWDPSAKGILTNPIENTTYYAYTQYWSNTDTTALMWLGFYDFSRSTATASPMAGTWNNLQSKIWINAQTISPPYWQRAGEKGDLEIPYIDENYYFRKPTKVYLQKGWNQVLLKMPIGKFASGIWYAPFKWMFTAVFVQPEKGSINMEATGKQNP